MSGGFLSRYATQSFPPEHRAALFCDNERRLTWLSLFFDAFPEAEAYLVGGTLRDIILGREPNDIDIVIRNVSIENLADWLPKHGAFEIAGKKFGTIKFAPHGTSSKQPIDIALPRTEFIGDEHFSGRSDLHVQFDPTLPIENDLARRDFTINAIAFDIQGYEIIDPWNGMEDLTNGVVRAVNTASERFFEDATRILRCLRFASQLGFSIEEHTWNAVKDFIHLLNTTRMREDGKHAYAVPREAIGKEFILGFSAHPTHTIALWKESGALSLFMPNISALAKNVEQDGTSALTKTLHALHLLEKSTFLSVHGYKKPNTTTLVATLFAFTESEHKNHATNTCKQLYFHQFPSRHPSFVDCKNVLWMVEHMRAFEHMDPAGMRPSKFEQMFCSERGRDLLLMMHAIAVASGSHSAARERLHTARRILEKMDGAICKDGERLPHLISGEDLKKLGVPEGPHYRELKNIVRDAQLTHRISSKEEALHLVKKSLV